MFGEYWGPEIPLTAEQVAAGTFLLKNDVIFVRRKTLVFVYICYYFVNIYEYMVLCTYLPTIYTCIYIYIQKYARYSEAKKATNTWSCF